MNEFSEGEKCADAVIALGGAATTNAMGAGKWPDELAQHFNNADIAVLPDNDPPGMKHAQFVAAKLQGTVRRIRIVELPGLGVKGDIADWIGAGGTLEQLLALIESNPAAFTEPYPTPQSEPVIEMASDITPEKIDWLWRDFLARGMLHIFAGAPETGKTTLALAYAAIISAGQHWPDGTRATIGKVLIWTNEDDVANSALDPDGCRNENIGIIRGQREKGHKRPFNPAIDMPSLIAKAKEIGGVDLLILDPVVAAVPVGKNSHNNSETRSGLQPVVDFAEGAGCAVIEVTHFTNGTAGQDPIERITGSLAFGALPRLVMATAKNLKDGPPRIFVRAKNNIGPSGGGFGYDLEPGPISYDYPDIIATRVIWLEPLEGTARELLAEAEQPDGKETKVEQAKTLLNDMLARGERRQTDIQEEAGRQGKEEPRYSQERASCRER